MKHFNLLICLLALLGFVACSDDGQVARSEIIPVSDANCKTHMDNTTRSEDFYPDSLVYEVRNNQLEIAVINQWVPCDLTKIQYEVSREANNHLTLTVRLLDGGAVNCMCPMDFSYTIDHLVAEETYHCDVVSNGFEGYSFDFTLTEGAKGTVYYKE